MNATLYFAGLTTSPLELVSFVLSVITVWLNIRQNHWAWLFAILSSSTYAGVFMHSRLYGDMALQFVFIAAAAWGWYQWVFTSTVEKPLRVTRLPPAGAFACVFGWAVGFALLGVFLHLYTDSDVPWIDGFLTAGSLLGTLLLSRKKLENWHVWIFLDILYVGLYAYKHLWLTAVLYGVFVFMAVRGLSTWKQDLDIDSLEPIDLRRL
ncbi:MAG TPA: nicotinamide riboside transporter PnuC [Burkholderiaceae bacterium]